MVSRRARLLEFAILGLLHEGPTHGYELRRRLNTALGPFRALSYGTLYPALKGLLDRGLIAEATDPAGPSGRRPRVVYELTPTGQGLRPVLESMNAWALSVPPTPDAEIEVVPR